MESGGTALKWTLYSLLAIIAVLIQTTIIQRIYFFDVHPYVLPVLVTCVAMHERPAASAAFGLFLGFLCDTFIMPSEVFFALVFMILALLISGLCGFMFRKNMVMSTLVSLACLLITSVLYFIVFFLIPGKAGFSALLFVTLPEILVSLPAVLLFYFPVRAINGRFT